MGTASKNSTSLLLIVHTVISLASCRKDSRSVNQPPVADAGKNETITLNTDGTLDGTASYDPDGKIVNYQWEKFTAPGDFTIQNPNSALTKVSGFRKAGEYRFKLTVTDDRDESTSAIKPVTVLNYLADGSSVTFNDLHWQFDNINRMAFLKTPDMPIGYPVNNIKSVYLSSSYPVMPSWYLIAKDGTTPNTFYYRIENKKVVAYIYYDDYDYTVWLVQYFGEQIKVEF